MKAVFLSYNQALTDRVNAILDDEKVAPLMAAFREMDAATKLQGSRAFVWNIEQTY